MVAGVGMPQVLTETWHLACRWESEFTVGSGEIQAQKAGW